MQKILFGVPFGQPIISIMKNFLNIKEAALFTGKSESTIKRLILKIDKENRKNKKVVNQIIKKEKAPKGFFWSISREFLEKEFSVGQPMDDQKTESFSENSENDQPKNGGEIPESEIVSILKDQLKTKDEQIKSLLERQRESNILIKGLQDQNLLLENGQPNERPKTEFDQPVVDQKNKPKTKKDKKTEKKQHKDSPQKPTQKGFWGRIFG